VACSLLLFIIVIIIIIIIYYYYYLFIIIISIVVVVVVVIIIIIIYHCRMQASHMHTTPSLFLVETKRSRFLCGNPAGSFNNNI